MSEKKVYLNWDGTQLELFKDEEIEEDIARDAGVELQPTEDKD